MPDLLFDTVDKITKYITENGLKENDPLPPANVMTEILNVSGIVYREALLYLKGLGVITSRRGSCFRIAKFDPAHIFNTAIPLYMGSEEGVREAGKLRAVLEIGIIGEVAKKADDELKKQLEDIVCKMDALLETKRVSLKAYEELERQFHYLICKASECNLLIIIMNALFKYINKMKDIALTEFDIELLKEANLGHKIISGAIRLNDSETALMAMKQHLYKKTMLGETMLGERLRKKNKRNL